MVKDVFRFVEVDVNRNTVEHVSAERLASALKFASEHGKFKASDVKELYLQLEQFFELPDTVILQFLRECGILKSKQKVSNLLKAAQKKWFRTNAIDRYLEDPF